MTVLKQRQHWMSVLAQSPFCRLQTCWAALSLTPEYTFVRPPETGLTQIRARMGATGRQFYLGDATMTRAVIRLASGELGYSYLQGRHKAHAELAAVIDALMQHGQYADLLQSEVIKPLAEMKQAQDIRRSREVAASQVDFFTMVRGED